MRKKQDKEGTIVTKLIDNALMTVDLGVLQSINSPFRMSSRDIKSVGKEYTLSLVCEWNFSKEERSLYLWTSMEGKYVEDMLIEHIDSLWDTLQQFPTALIERIKNYVASLKSGECDVLADRIEKEGILDIHSLVLPQGRRDKMLKIPYTCALSFKGHVFDGIDGIRDSCHKQEDDAVPYLLEKTGILPPVDDDPYYHERYRCYMMCHSKESAEMLMESFLGLNVEDENGFESLDYIIEQERFPPIVFYVEREKHMFLSY